MVTMLRTTYSNCKIEDIVARNSSFASMEPATNSLAQILIPIFSRYTDAWTEVLMISSITISQELEHMCLRSH